MEKLADPENYRSDPQAVWQKIRAPSRNAAVLGRLKAVAAWREVEAMDKNIPRGRIMRDETLADIASHPPREQHELAKVRGLSAGWKENDIGRRLMQAIADSKPLTDAELPPRAPRGAPLGKEGALVADLLKLLLKIRSREIDIAARLLARSDDLEALAAGQRKGLQILEGWRFEQFGRDALELVEGKVAFAVIKNRLKMAHIDAIAASGEEHPDAHLGDPDGSLSLSEDGEGDGDGRNWDEDDAPAPLADAGDD
jgi:ribonuclease D